MSQANLSKKGKKSPPKTPPKSLFASGKFKSSTSPFSGGRKDNRHLLHYVGIQQGVVVFWPEKHNAEEEPFLMHDFQLFHNEPENLEELGINAILSRKGEDGKTPRTQTTTSKFPWSQFVAIVGANNNTSAKRKAQSTKIVDYLNNQATSANYKFPHKFKLGQDYSTKGGLEPCSAYLLDNDVLGLMLSAYPSTPLEEVVTFDSIMSTFWLDIGHAREIVEAHVATNPESNRGDGDGDGDDDDNNKSNQEED